MFGTMIPDDFELNEDEIKTMKRFLEALQDVGVQCRIEGTMVLSRQYDGETARLLFNDYLTDVRRANVRSIYTAGVSLEELVAIAREANFFPDDFLPSSHIVQKCFNGFWSYHRR